MLRQGGKCWPQPVEPSAPPQRLGDQFYKDAIEQCRSYNARLCAERSVRLPFLDSQTGVAQNNCYIWMERHHRSPGVTAGQMYTYPARCWRKKRRLENSTDARLGIYGLHLGGSLMTKDSLPSQSTTLEALLRGEGLDRRNNSKNDEESLLEIQRVLEADAAEDAFDDDDYEVDTPKRRHRGKGRGRGSGRRRADADDDKPYICDTFRFRQIQTEAELQIFHVSLREALQKPHRTELPLHPFPFGGGGASQGEGLRGVQIPVCTTDRQTQTSEGSRWDEHPQQLL
eukprot:XP_011615017.1 PREDICTED: zinc finger protein DPF3-like isoform X3 [Takifugu rubripes]